MTLRAYFDRSELGDPADVAAVTGYVSPGDLWDQFEPEWRAVLDEFGIKTFHMNEFECRLGEFDGWKQDRRTALLTRLIAVIGGRAWVGIGAAIVLADYRALDPKDQERLGSPYAMCGVKVVADTLKWIDQRFASVAARQGVVLNEIAKSVKIEFVFEAGDEGAGELAAALKREQASGPYAGRISWKFENKGVGALQAADFVAYETTKQLVRTIGADEREMRKSLDAFLDKTEYVAEYFNERSMREILARMEPPTVRSQSASDPEADPR